MIQHASQFAPTDATAAREPRRPRIWGLSATACHDAYWNALGIQCVRRGGSGELQRAADMYMLLEPGEMVLFDVRRLADRLSWRNASVTRLRLVPETTPRYDERAVVDASGVVQRIERIYRASTHSASRILITPSRRLARLWSGASSWRDGWRAIRRRIRRSGLDRLRCEGIAGRAGDVETELRLLNRLVHSWHAPDLAIDGIVEVEPGVWALHGRGIPDEAVVIGPAWLGSGVEQLRALVVSGDVVPDAPGSRPVAVRVRRIAEIEAPQAGREPVERPADARARGLGQMAKRMIDITASAGGLACLAPGLAAIALLILLDDGSPVFFGHERQTIGGRPFRCWKFRTMRKNAEAVKAAIAARNLCDGPQFYIENDPRVTPIGRILRNYHLDELPQLWNVLCGHMSLVGPRPSPDDENRICPAWRELRLSVRPGMTGLWQLRRTRRAGVDFQEWIRYDIEYVRRASLGLDLRILAETAWRLTLGRRSSSQ